MLAFFVGCASIGTRLGEVRTDSGGRVIVPTIGRAQCIQTVQMNI